MIRIIKKVLAHRQVKQVPSRLANNRKQLKAIYKGLEERGY